ncbi:MAG: hypothetical protein II970_08750 [Paludibacteraceae bacterium]|nr:hypothetical protein [Paludibacteraceae bacterium]
MLNLILSIIVSATIDSTTVFIGDQTNLRLQATTEKTEHVQLPVYGETLIPDIEIVGRTQTDTVTLPDGRLQLSQRLTITSFKDSLFYIPPIKFVAGGDTLYSTPLSLNVIQPFEVDSAMAITPIKDIYKAPIWWWGIIRWILLGLAIACAAAGGVWAWKKWGYLLRKNENEPAAQEPLRPAEEVALEKLDSIRERKIWQNGQVKEYHTELTDVVREYIGRRFDVRSTEKTSDETLRAMKPLLEEQKDLYTGLARMLQLADLVKFAKWSATPDENESCLHTAYRFVRDTTPAEAPEETSEENTTDTK